jgi:hypothetical protein
MPPHRVGWDRHLFFSQDGERHKTMLRLFNTFIGTESAVAEFNIIREVEARWLVLKLSETSGNMLTLIRTYVFRPVH